jgi:hypothetical protein
VRIEFLLSDGTPAVESASPAGVPDTRAVAFGVAWAGAAATGLAGTSTGAVGAVATVVGRAADGVSGIEAMEGRDGTDGATAAVRDGSSPLMTVPSGRTETVLTRFGSGKPEAVVEDAGWTPPAPPDVSERWTGAEGTTLRGATAARSTGCSSRVTTRLEPTRST